MIFSHKNNDESELVKECMEYYELNDIFLNQDQRYQQLKNELMNSSMVDLKSFKQFIQDTRGTVLLIF